MKLSTHVLDTASGKPAAGVRIDLLRGHYPDATPIKTVATNSDGRTDAPLLEGAAFVPGPYTLVFHAADYFRGQRHADAGKFLEQVPIAFVITEAASHHVPLLLSPWSYSTYRGS
jgi:5-hydroxyisourate hydrolase